MKACISYEQTADERYESDQNEVIHDMLEKAYALKVTGGAGGYDFTRDVADEELDVEGSRRDIKGAAEGIRKLLKRSVKVTWIYPWTPSLRALKWQFWTLPRWQRAHRNDPPFDPNLPEE